MEKKFLNFLLFSLFFAVFFGLFLISETAQADCGCLCNFPTCAPVLNPACAASCVPTVPNCNTVCPPGCTVNEDYDCGCLDGNGCCGIGCNNANDNDCAAGCVPTVPPCDGVCPPGCTVNEDPDCGCQAGNGCCGIGCNNANDNDCPVIPPPPPPSSIVGNTYTITNIETGVVWKATYAGLVPCGRTPTVITLPDGGTKDVTIDCTLCHLFVMIDGIVDFVLLTIVPPISIIVIIFAGISFYMAMGNPEKFSRAKSVLFSVIIGLVIIYVSWFIISEVLVKIMGVADWVGIGEGWFRIKCPIASKIIEF